MFENAELGHRVDRPTYEREAPLVRAALLEAQRELAAADLSVVVIVTGVGGAGKSETVNLLMEWMDRRYRHLTVARVLLDALRGRLDRVKAEPTAPPPEPLHLVPPAVNVI